MTALSYAVSSLRHMVADAWRIGATHCLSIGDASAPAPATPVPVALEAEARKEAGARGDLHVVLQFSDVCRTASPEGPQRSHVEQIVKFAQGIDDHDRVLIHCAAGISRSTAAAWIADMEFRHRRGTTHGLELFTQCREELQRRRPIAMPNPIMMSHYLEMLHDRGLARDVTPAALTALRFHGTGFEDIEDDLDP